MDILDTSEPVSAKALTDEQIFQALMANQMRVEGLNQQLFNAATLIEYLVEVMNGYAGPNDDYPLEVSTEEFSKFYKERLEEINQQMQEVMSEKVSSMAESVSQSNE